MELKEREEVFWEEFDPRFLFALPVHFPFFEYRDMLIKDGARIIIVDSSTNRKTKFLQDSLDVSRASTKYVGVMHSVDSVMSQEETIYVFKDGNAQALLTQISFPASLHPVYRKSHTVLELRADYQLADEITSLALKRLRIYESPSRVAVSI